MKIAFIIHFWRLATAIVLVTGQLQLASAEIRVVGPGPVEPLDPFGGNVHILDGTEIIATGLDEVRHHPPGRLVGRRAISGTFSGLRIDGGVFRGASLSVDQAGYTSASGGTVMHLAEGVFDLDIRGGEFAGGSVVTNNNIALDDANGGRCVILGDYTRVSIHGGRFEGGVASVSPTPTAEELNNRASLFLFSSFNELDIYSGEFVGKIDVRHIHRLAVFGSELSITPTPTPAINPKFINVASDFVLSGKYLDGTPFSIQFEGGGGPMFALRPGAFTIGVNPAIPEPSAIAIAAIGVACCGIYRKRREFLAMQRAGRRVQVAKMT